MSTITDEFITEWVISYLSGKTLPQIANHYGVSQATVRKYLLLNGVEMRPRGIPSEGVMTLDGKCSKEHELSIHGVERKTPKGTRVVCLECDRLRQKERYQQDDTYREHKKKVNLEYKNKKRKEKK